jgi:hypothetical protein
MFWMCDKQLRCPAEWLGALKTWVRGFLECFSKPPVLQMKNIVSQEFKRTERLDLVMMKPEDSPSHTIPIRASHSQPTSSVAHMPCLIPRAVESLKKETEFRVDLDQYQNKVKRSGRVRFYTATNSMWHWLRQVCYEPSLKWSQCFLGPSFIGHSLWMQYDILWPWILLFKSLWCKCGLFWRLQLLVDSASSIHRIGESEVYIQQVQLGIYVTISWSLMWHLLDILYEL